jgi:hypothetical protein
VVGGGRAHQHTRTRTHARRHLVSQEEDFICQKLAVGWLTALKKLSVCWGCGVDREKLARHIATALQQTGCKYNCDRTRLRQASEVVINNTTRSTCVDIPTTCCSGGACLLAHGSMAI